MNHKTNVNTSPDATQANVVNTTLRFDGIRQQSFDIENFVLDARVLLEQIHGQLDTMVELPLAANDAIAVINCFVTCALRNVALIAAANINILNASTGGAV